MFGNKNTNILNPVDTHGYKQAIKAIKLFTASQDWKKTYKAIDEVKTKEEDSYNTLIEKLSKDDHDINKSAKEKEFKVFQKKLDELEKLRKIASDKEAKYNKIEDAKRFKLRFKKIKKELVLLSKTWKHDLAINLISVFLEENKEKSMVVDFYNKEKKKILHEKEKTQRIESEKNKKKCQARGTETYREKNHRKQWKKSQEKARRKKTVTICIRWFFCKYKRKIKFLQKSKTKLRKEKTHGWSSFTYRWRFKNQKRSGSQKIGRYA